MRFPIHTILYTKNWYKKRGTLDVQWMDYCHTIDADGWTVFTKGDVCEWFLHRYDDMKDSIWHHDHLHTTAKLFERINDEKWGWMYTHHNNVLDEEDYIIAVIADYFSLLSTTDVIGWKVPNQSVLPFNLFGPYVSSYPEKVWIPAQMMCDKLKEIDRVFGDLEKDEGVQVTYNYELVEAQIMNKDYRNVVPLLGSDCKAKPYRIKGYILNHPDNHEFDGEHCLDMGIYRNCKFDPDQLYEVKVEDVDSKFEFLDEKDYIVRSIQ